MGAVGSLILTSLSPSLSFLCLFNKYSLNSPYNCQIPHEALGVQRDYTIPAPWYLELG